MPSIEGKFSSSGVQMLVKTLQKPEPKFAHGKRSKTVNYLIFKRLGWGKKKELWQRRIPFLLQSAQDLEIYCTVSENLSHKRLGRNSSSYANHLPVQNRKAKKTQCALKLI
ncbi:cysteine and tyrosine-rich protein 1 [Platysternon megacephalum]|uniref:Cysteine and tyrosine-rich protein 1 n=1 Tax=Platysternon megacephalum TaxID=55544 RepID=A0A4D9E737_9SAUR|nr:cysteine and tyrosine-rich protein 1 [Platysternon megacephalum]